MDSTYNIKWISYETSGGVKIEYSLNDGLEWREIIASTPDTGIYPWTVPDTMSYNCLISISDTNGILSDTSDEMFTIFSDPFIAVISPNGGEVWHMFFRNIIWSSAGTSGGVRIEYSINNGLDWTIIVDSTLDDEIYSWNMDIPYIDIDTIWSLDSCLVRVSDTNNNTWDISDAVFTILPPSGVPTSKSPEDYSLDIRGIVTGNQLEFSYALPEKTNLVKFTVYNIASQKIKEEVLKGTTAGFYSGKLNMSGISKGIYFIRMEVNGGKFTQTRKFLLL